VPPLFTALRRGLVGLCPACGQTHAFRGYLTVVPRCVACGAPLGAVRADDAPPYFTIFISGHIVIPLLFYVDHTYNPPIWVLSTIFVHLMALLCLALLRPVKGATLGLMLKLGMMKQDDE
jgi:uncharacterized protein (DUF983 family)